MKFTLAVLLFLIFQIPVFAQSDFKVSVLSEQGQKAYEVILHAKQFEDLSVAYFGLNSTQVASIGILSREPQADRAFKSLVRDATMEGALYALGGIYFTDPDFYYKTVAAFKSSDLKVSRMRGCLVLGLNVKDVIESNDPNVAIIGSGESFEQYLTGVEGSNFTLDFANGGFPAALKHFADKQKESVRWKRNTSLLE